MYLTLSEIQMKTQHLRPSWTLKKATINNSANILKLVENQEYIKNYLKQEKNQL